MKKKKKNIQRSFKKNSYQIKIKKEDQIVSELAISTPFKSKLFIHSETKDIKQK